jgi:uncharacterized protein
MNKQYVLITGASKGLGRAFAEEFARKGNNLLLVALPNDDLYHVAQILIHKYNVRIECFETNLAEPGRVEQLASEVNARFDVRYLINNAGTGGTSQFLSAPAYQIDELIMINIRALSLLTRLILPNLMRQPDKAFILNVASMASFSPMTYKAVYCASKAYVYYFSRALSEELKNTNVSVSVVHPGPMKTNEEITRNIEKQGVYAKVFGLISPEKTAAISIRRLEREEKFIVPGLVNWWNWIAMRLIPIKIQLYLGYKVSAREISLN